MTAQTALFSADYLRAWLPGFQAELTADLAVEDDTRRPAFYALRYPESVYGLADGWAESFIFFDHLFPERGYSAQEAAEFILTHEPALAMRLARENEAGFMLISGKPVLADRDDFTTWAQDPRSEWGCTGVATRQADEPGIVFLTRSRAERELANYADLHPSGARPYAHSLARSPELDCLVALVCALDLDKSTLVFKAEVAS